MVLDVEIFLVRFSSWLARCINFVTFAAIGEILLVLELIVEKPVDNPVVNPDIDELMVAMPEASELIVLMFLFIPPATLFR